MSMEKFTQGPQGNNVSLNLLEHLRRLDGAPLTDEDLSPLTEKVTPLEEMIPGILPEDTVVSLDHCPNEIEEIERDSETITASDNFVSYIANFIENLKKNKPKEFENLKLKFKDSIIVDLGAGENFAVNYRIACVLGAKGYIGIEPYNWRQLFQSCLTLDHPWFLKEKNPLINLVAEDAVSFLKRLPDNSVCLLNAGIGDILMDKDYIKDFKSEMARVLKKGGVCMISNSSFPEGINNIIYETGFVDKTKTTEYHGPIEFVQK
jgi:hypothetical protein